MSGNIKKQLIYSIFVLALSVYLGGCASVPTTPAPPKITFDIKPHANTNFGQPFYIVIRSVSEKDFLTENYKSIADMIFTDPPDPSILKALAILPDNAKEIVVEKPDKMDVGIYCLFTKPSEKWKMILSQPLNTEYSIELENSEIIQPEEPVEEEGFVDMFLGLFSWGE